MCELVRISTLSALVLAWTPTQAQEIELPAGGELEVRIDADFNGDGFPDLAYLAATTTSGP